MSRPRRRLSRCHSQHARRLLHNRISNGGRHIKRRKPTSNGFSPLWIEAINQVLEDREESDIRVADLDYDIWEKFLGPLIDFVEDNPLYFEE